MAHEFRSRRRVEFADTDMAGIVHFAAFFRWMEATEHAFYREVGFDLSSRLFERSFGLPRVHAECDYLRPVRFQDEVEAHLTVVEVGRSSASYSIVFRRREPAGWVDVARGRLTVVYVTRDPSADRMRAAPFPEDFVGRIEVAPSEQAGPIEE